MKKVCSSFMEASILARQLASSAESPLIQRDGSTWIVLTNSESGEEERPTGCTQVWVGQFQSTGTIVVFDPSLAFEGVEDTYGFVVEKNLMRRFTLTDEVHWFTQERDPQPLRGRDANDAIQKYTEWKEHNLQSFLDSETDRIETKKNRQISRHKDHLAKLGKPYSGVRLNSPTEKRVTHCYSCQKGLDSDIHLECNGCGWLICQCGACGCGYTP